MEGNTNDDSRVSQCNSKKGFKTKPSQAWAPAASHRCSAPSPSTSFQWAIERCRSGAKVLKKVRFGVGHAQSGTNSSLTGLCTERALHCIRVSLRCWQGPMIWHLRKPLESSNSSWLSPFSILPAHAVWTQREILPNLMNPVSVLGVHLPVDSDWLWHLWLAASWLKGLLAIPSPLWAWRRATCALQAQKLPNQNLLSLSLYPSLLLEDTKMLFPRLPGEGL